MSRFALFVILIFQLNNVFGTNQYKDLLIINKDTFSIDSPIDNKETDSSFVDNWYNKIAKSICFHTACWRGAIFIWELKNDSVYLTKLLSCCDKKEIDLSIIDKAHGCIFANWINGSYDYLSGNKICLDIFHKLFSDDSNYIFEYDNLITIKKGKVVKQEIFDNRKTIIGKFDSESIIFDKVSQILIDNLKIGQKIDFDLTFKSDDNGRMTDIEFDGIGDSLLINDLTIALKNFEGLPIYYRFGKKINHQFEKYFKITK